MNKDVVLKIKTSETKMEIIKELSKGQRTPSDLSRLLKKSKSTVVEHLDSLINAGLVNKIERPGRKWVFYSLTKNGYDIIEVKPRISAFVLAGSLLSIIGGFVVLNLGKVAVQPKTFTESNILTAMRTPAEVSASIPTMYIYTSIALFVLGVSGIVFYLYKTKMRVLK